MHCKTVFYLIVFLSQVVAHGRERVDCPELEMMGHKRLPLDRCPLIALSCSVSFLYTI